MDVKSGGFVAFHVVVQRHYALFVAHAHLVDERLQQRRVIQGGAALQEVSQPLGVYLLVLDRLKVELGAVALVLKLRYALFGPRRDNSLLNGVEDVLKAALGD
ncbi:hypothetical protein [Senegalimassilia faecalis]|uniref:hypothetical protein n=1 Tax=Senegalimassilia faecalis TaxID=2509433 RepID=UPI003A974CD7